MYIGRLPDGICASNGIGSFGGAELAWRSCANDDHGRERAGHEPRDAWIAYQRRLLDEGNYVGNAGGELDFIADALLAVNEKVSLRQSAAVPARLRIGRRFPLRSCESPFVI